MLAVGSDSRLSLLGLSVVPTEGPGAADGFAYMQLWEERRFHGMEDFVPLIRAVATRDCSGFLNADRMDSVLDLASSDLEQAETP